MGLGHRRGDHVEVEGSEAAKVDHLCRDVVGGQGVGRGQALRQRAAGGYDRDVFARPPNGRLPGVVVLGILLDRSLGCVKQRMLADDHRVGIGERRRQHPPGVGDRGRCEHLEPRDVGEPDLETVRMLRRELPARTGGHPDHQRHRELAGRHVPQGGGIVDDLVEGQEREVDRHDLHDRPEAGHGRADARAQEGVFRERSVADAIGAELLEQALAAGVGAAVATHVFAHQKHTRVGVERFTHARADGLAIGHRPVSVGCRELSPTRF